MTLHYTIGRDLWIIAAVQMPATWHCAEKFKGALNDLDKQMETIAAAKKRQPRVLLGGDWNATWPALKGIPEDYYDSQADDRGATVGQFFMKWNISGPEDCVVGNIKTRGPTPPAAAASTSATTS